MKTSEITIEDLKEYIRINSEDDDKLLEQILQAAKSYINNYTGLDETVIDDKEDISIALYCLCAEMYDNRQYSVDKEHTNNVVKSILNMHRVNFL